MISFTFILYTLIDSFNSTNGGLVSEYDINTAEWSIGTKTKQCGRENNNRQEWVGD